MQCRRRPPVADWGQAISHTSSGRTAMTQPLWNSRRFLVALGKAAALAVVAASALYVAARPDSRAADKSDPPKAAAGPLDYLPADAAVGISVRVADLWGCPLAKAGRNALGKDLVDDLDKIRKQFG